MDLIRAATFTFNYAAYDQASALKVAARVYDVSTGSPVFLATVPMSNIVNGCYSGNYTGGVGKTYLVIAAVFTDPGYTTPDLSRAPNPVCFQVTGNAVLSWAFVYGAFDQNATLNIRTAVYNVTTGIPVFVQNIVPVFVELGCYFGLFAGLQNNSYELISVVYTDNTFTTPLNNYSPDNESFTTLIFGSSSGASAGGAMLVGQKLSANLQGQSLAALLKQM